MKSLLTKMSIVNIHSSGSHIDGEYQGCKDQKRKKEQKRVKKEEDWAESQDGD